MVFYRFVRFFNIWLTAREAGLSCLPSQSVCVGARGDGLASQVRVGGRVSAVTFCGDYGVQNAVLPSDVQAAASARLAVGSVLPVCGPISGSSALTSGGLRVVPLHPLPCKSACSFAFDSTPKLDR